MSKQSLNVPYLVLMGVVLISIGVGAVVLRPAWGTLKATRAELATAQATLAERQAFLQTLDQRKAELLREQESEKILQVMLPSDNADDEVARLLQRVSTTAGVTVVTISSGGTGNVAALKALRARGQETDIPALILPVQFSADIRGSYQQYRVFIEQLDRAVRLADVRTIDLERDETQPDVVTAKLTLRFYQYQPDSNGK